MTDEEWLSLLATSLVEAANPLGSKNTEWRRSARSVDENPSAFAE